jgi:F0F1-type ATP synthase assembly protein I
VTADELLNLRRVALRVALGQAALTAVIALGCFIALGRFAALSATIGGGIGTIATVTLALIAFRKAGDVPQMLSAFYLGEAAKVAVMVLLFVVVLITLKKVMVPGALFGAYVATFFVHWVLLTRTLRKSVGK